MKYKKVTVVLLIEAIVCIMLTVSNIKSGALYEHFITFPFVYLARGLRWLSLSGSGGNAIAWILFVFIGAIPLIVWGIRRHKEELRSWDALLWVMSGMVFGILYLLINPGLISRYLTPVGMESTGAMILGSTFYALLSGYVILTFIKKLVKVETLHLLDYLSVFIFILAMLSVASVFSTTTRQIMLQMSNLRENNTMFGINFLVSDVFIVLREFGKGLPSLLNIWIMYLGGCLLDALKENQYGEKVVFAAKKLENGCKTVISLTVLSIILIHISQLFFSKQLLSSDYHLMIPVMSMMFLLMIMLMSRYFADSRRLKNEVDSFI